MLHDAATSTPEPLLNSSFSQSPNRLPRLFWPAVVSLAVCLLVFVAPLLVPCTPVHGISVSYLAGFNNSMAVLGAAGLSVAVLLGAFWATRHQAPSALPSPWLNPMSWRFVTAVVVCSSAILSLCSVIVAVSGERYLGDAGYFIEQASNWSDTHRRLYSQIEFAYGPLLVLPAAWFARVLHVSVTAGYFVTFVLESALGLYMLAFVLNHLPLRQNVRRYALVLCAVAAITPHLGVNYTYFRFVSPLAIFLFVAGRPRKPALTALLMTVGIGLELAISPELAFALALGIVMYAGLKTWQEGATWLLVAVLPLTGLWALLLTAGRPYVRMVSAFSHGTYNLPLGPYPHVLVYLAALGWLAPVGLVRTARLAKQQGALLLGVYGVSLAMVSAALSRCDPLHIVFNGVGMLVLSLLFLNGSSHSIKLGWMACLLVLVLWEHRVNDAFFSYRTARIVRNVVLPHLPAATRRAVFAAVTLPDKNLRTVHDDASSSSPLQRLDLEPLKALVGDEHVATPLEISPGVEAQLKAAKLYSPLYRAFGVDMGDQHAEEETVGELRAYRWMLLPTERDLEAYQVLPQNVGSLQGMRMYFRERNPLVFVPGAALEASVARDWFPAQRFGQYTLYGRRGKGR